MFCNNGALTSEHMGTTPYDSTTPRRPVQVDIVCGSFDRPHNSDPVSHAIKYVDVYMKASANCNIWII